MNNRNEETRGLHECIDKSMDELCQIWNFIGISGELRTSRRGLVLMHLENLLDEMVREEKALKDKLVENIRLSTNNVAMLCSELGIPKYELPKGLTVLHAEKELKQKEESLKKEKEERMTTLKSLMKTDKELSEFLDTTPYYINHSKVPTQSQLQDFQAHVSELEKEKSRRFEKLMKMQKEIVECLDKLELSPNTSFERNVVCEFDLISLTADNINSAEKYMLELEMLCEENSSKVNSLWSKIRSIWLKLKLPEFECGEFESENAGISQRVIVSLEEELQRCEDLKLQNIKQFVEATRVELDNLWDDCYIPKEVRNQFVPYFETVMSEELLDQHESEVRRLKEFYDNNKEMLHLVSTREKLWRDYIEFEKRAQDPARFANRGGSLLDEEKMRKSFTSNLPKVEREVMLQVRAWEKETGRTFLIGGMKYEDYLVKQKEMYETEEKNKKIMKQQQKAKQMEDEIKFGSKPATPGTKRFAATTPSKTPNKCRKFESPTPSRYSSAKKCHRNLLMSPTPSRLKENVRPLSSQVNTLASMGSSTMERAISCQTLSSTRSSRPPRVLIGGSVADLNHAISTTVIAPKKPGEAEVSSSSLCPVGHYDDFANGLNKVSRNNSRSTLIPKTGSNCL